MKIFKYLSFVAVVIFLFLQSANAQAVITSLGNHPFYHTSLKSTDDLLKMVKQNESDIQTGFTEAGMSKVFDDFIDQLPNAEIKKVEIKDGSNFEWMFGRKDGKGPIRLAKNVTWVNNSSFSAFQFHIDSNEKRYTFIVPLVCGNLTLSGVTNAPIVIPPVVEVAAPIVEKPKEPIISEKKIAPAVVAAPTVTKSYCGKPGWKLGITAGYPLGAAQEDQTANFGLLLGTPLGIKVGPLGIGLGAGAFSYDFDKFYFGGGLLASLCINDLLNLEIPLTFQLHGMGFYIFGEDQGLGVGGIGSATIPFGDSPFSLGLYGGLGKYYPNDNGYIWDNVGAVLFYSL
ncbi:MAG: hypothetical protein MUP82_04760 [Candidatus Marinimicrobia bacterium]|nr:hypothetical protein [Candidatus Neomarinimicrobiota bacterium]